MKRKLAILLAFALVLSLLPVQVFASETVPEGTAAVEETVPAVTEAVEQVSDELNQEAVAAETTSMTQEEFKNLLDEAVAAGTDAVLTKAVHIDEDMRIYTGSNKLIVQGVELIVLNGAAVTIDGNVEIRGSGSAWGSFWINDGGVVHVNGEMNATSETTAIHVGYHDGGTLNLNGTLNTNGYLNVPGKLNASEGSVLNIKNDENGCGYLENNGDTVLHGTVNVDGLMGTSANLHILGTVNASETSSTYVYPGGSFALEGSLTSDGLIEVEGSESAWGAIWINNGAVANINGEMNLKNEYAAVHVGYEGGGTLNLNGTLNTNGYLNVPGKLNASEGSVLNIKNDENGCGYLENNGDTVLHGTVNVDGLMGTSANLHILGTVNASETSSTYVYPGGSFALEGSLTSDGLIEVEGSESAWGAIWINNGAVANINGEMNLKNEYAAVHVGYEGGGTLNLNGTLNTNGYLNVPGKLYASEGSILNIKNDENGCGYLDNSGETHLAGTVNVDGLLTTGKNPDTDTGDGTLDVGGTMNAGSTSSISVLAGGTFNTEGTLSSGGEVKVEKNGTLNVGNGGEVFINLSMKNNGNVLVATGGTLNMSQNWEGNEPVDQGGTISSVKPVIETTPMYRLYNPNSGEHFYTGSIEERDMLEEAGWNYEGIAWNAPVYEGDPVHRVFNPNSGDHHYTMSWDEVEMLVELGWQYENVAWNSASAENLPLYRLYNPNADCGSHHYTGSEEERENLVEVGWHYEGIGWYGMLH